MKMYSTLILYIFRRIFSLSFIQKLPHCQNGDETFVTKNRCTKMANNAVYTILVSLAVCHFVGVTSLFVNSVQRAFHKKGSYDESCPVH